jgi:hypothetical protein
MTKPQVQSTRFLQLSPPSNTATSPRPLRIFLLLPQPLLSPLTLFPPPAPTRRTDNDAFSALHSRRVLPSETDDPLLNLVSLLTYVPDPQIQPTGGVFAAFEAVRVEDSPLGEDRDLYWDSEFNVPDYAVAAAVEASPAGVGAEREFAEDDGVSSFEDFRVGDSCVRHVCVDAGGAGPGWALRR